MIIEFGPGTTLAKAAQQLVAAAQSADCIAIGEFNRCILQASPVTTEVQVVDAHHQHCQASSDRFEASPEGQEYRAKQESDRRELIERAEPGLTVYRYELDNYDGRWERLEREVYFCFELWDGIEPIDACIGYLPQDWLENAVLSNKPSPEQRFT
jgi:hypothetical protein